MPRSPCSHGILSEGVVEVQKGRGHKVKGSLDHSAPRGYEALEIESLSTPLIVKAGREFVARSPEARPQKILFPLTKLEGSP